MFIFYPRSDSTACPPNGFDLFVSVDDDVSVHTRFYMGDQPWPWILFFHGNGEVVSDYDEIAPFFHQRGLNLAVAGYRGYGASGGVPTLTHIVRDAHLIFKGVKEELSRRHLPGGLWIMGRSLGSISAIELAYHYPSDIRGLIIESGFTSVVRIMAHLGVPAGSEFMKIDQDCLEMIRGITTAALVIHGEKDTLVPVREAEALYSHLGTQTKKLLIIPSGTHNDIMLAGLRRYFDGLQEFIRETSL
jgi:hypothetical protein